jgi:rod shape determining protein RodA
MHYIHPSQKQSWWQKTHLDLPLLIGIFVMLGFGLMILYSASGQNINMITRQLVRIGLALILMLLVAQISPPTLQKWVTQLFLMGILLLIAVLLIGHTGKGAQRWLDLGFFRFQPSEMMKIIVPMMIAGLLAEVTLPPSAKHLFIACVLIILPVLLIAKQPDLGTSLLIASSGIFVILLAGLSWVIIFLSGFFLTASLPVVWMLLHDYQKQRVLTFLNPESDPLGTGYHIIQSKIAIGSGGMNGKGWLEGSQSYLAFLPERTTDFIFSVFSEEFGIIGVLVLLSIYGFIIFRGISISLQAQDTFSRLLGGSLILTFFVYIFVNIGMVSGLLPVVGVPLPLVSYGGTSMVTIMISFGILMSIQSHRKLLPT